MRGASSVDRKVELSGEHTDIMTGRCWHSNAYFSLFSSLFFFDPPNRFVQIPRDLS